MSNVIYSKEFCGGLTSICAKNSQVKLAHPFKIEVIEEEDKSSTLRVSFWEGGYEHETFQLNQKYNNMLGAVLAAKKLTDNFPEKLEVNSFPTVAAEA